MRHSYLERGLYRVWFNNGQSIEVSWGKRWRHLCCQVLVHSNESDDGHRMLNLGLGPAQIFIPLGISHGPYQVGEEPGWGFNFFDRAIHLKWGKRFKLVNLPWSSVCVGHEVQTAIGAWVPYVGSWEDKEPDGRAEHTFDYTYTLKSGEVQKRIATISVQRFIRRYRWLRWTSWFEDKTPIIDVRFNGEVGERTGSWKGGTIGCGYSMLPGEAPVDTLRRMERERVFR